MHAVVAQLVEHQLPKLRVTSSSLAYRSESNKPLTIHFVGGFFVTYKQAFESLLLLYLSTPFVYIVYHDCK